MRRSTDRFQVGIALLEDFIHSLLCHIFIHGGSHRKYRVFGAASHAIFSVGIGNGITKAATVCKIGSSDFCAGEVGEISEVHLGQAEIIHVYQLVKENPLHLRVVRASVGANNNLILGSVVSAEDIVAAEAGLAGKVPVGCNAAADAIQCSQHEAYHWTRL